MFFSAAESCCNSMRATVLQAFSMGGNWFVPEELVVKARYCVSDFVGKAFSWKLYEIYTMEGG